MSKCDIVGNYMPRLILFEKRKSIVFKMLEHLLCMCVNDVMDKMHVVHLGLKHFQQFIS